jgi:hypothetical protein
MSGISWSVAGAAVWFAFLRPVLDTMALVDAARVLDATVADRTTSTADSAVLRAEAEQLRAAIADLLPDPAHGEALRTRLASRLDAVDAHLVAFDVSDRRSGLPNIVSADVVYRLRTADLERSIRALLDGPFVLTIRSLDVRRSSTDETGDDELVVRLGIDVLAGSGGET